jgi:hypothetical protein
MSAPKRAEAHRLKRKAANSTRARTLSKQNPNKTEQKRLDLLGFILPNQDFSRVMRNPNKNPVPVSGFA